MFQTKVVEKIKTHIFRRWNYITAHAPCMLDD